ncbi:hypothetical protein B9479_008309, partial [Cryptococcus floricola]
MSTGGSHEESVHSDPRPRMRQDTPWAGPAPTTDMTAIIAMMANMQQQMQQQSAAIIDLLAREKNTPAPVSAPAPAPAPSSVSTPERARTFKRPDKLVCPTLTRFTKDPFIIIRHLHALKAHLDMGLFSIDSEFYYQWEIEQCNLSISSVGQWVAWAREEGTREATFAGWSKAWKEHVLDPDWVRHVRRSLSQKRMEGSTPRHFETFSTAILDHQHLLKGSTDPLNEMDVKRALLEGLSSMIVRRVERDLKSESRTLFTISIHRLVKIIHTCVVDANAEHEAYASYQATLRPPPPHLPRTPPRPTYRVNAISASPRTPPRLPTDTDARVWLDPATRLPPGPEGTRARTFLIQRGLCFGCRQPGHMVQSCPASLPQVASLSPGFPQSSAPPSPSPLAPLQESVPLLLVNARLDADGPSYQSLVDSGAAVNVIDEKLVEELGLATRKMVPIAT